MIYFMIQTSGYKKCHQLILVLTWKYSTAAYYRAARIPFCFVCMCNWYVLITLQCCIQAKIYHKVAVNEGFLTAPGIMRQLPIYSACKNKVTSVLRTFGVKRILCVYSGVYEFMLEYILECFKLFFFFFLLCLIPSLVLKTLFCEAFEWHLNTRRPKLPKTIQT